MTEEMFNAPAHFRNQSESISSQLKLQLKAIIWINSEV